MLLPETKIYKALSTSDKLLNLMKQLRIAECDDNLIFNQDIPENYQVTNYAPIVRINYVGCSYRASDNVQNIYRPRVLVSFWVKELEQGEQMFNIIKKILSDIGYYLYSEDHEEDLDTGDQLDNKMYVFRMYVHGLEVENEE